MKFALVLILALALTSVLAVPGSDKKEGEPKPKKNMFQRIFSSKSVKAGKKEFADCTSGKFDGELLDCVEKSAQTVVKTASKQLKDKVFYKDYSNRLVF